MSSFDAGDFAALAMYPFVPLVGSWDLLYATVAGEVVGAPTELRWDLEPRDTWLSPQLALGQTCGWPLVTFLRGRVRTIGAFVHRVDGVSSHLYRSVIVGQRQMALEDFWGSRAAVNSDDSLSGYISLLAALPGANATWPGEVLWTGAHIASLEAVRNGDADVASIDGMTWAYLARDAPNLVEGLVVVGQGPTVPTLPLIAPERASDELVAEWRTAFAQAVRNPALAEALDVLMIDGFVAMDLADYDDALRTLIDTQPIQPT